MIKLSWWEEFIVGAGVSLLSVLAAKVTNPTEQAGIEAALTFLKKLASGNVSIT